MAALFAALDDIDNRLAWPPSAPRRSLPCSALPGALIFPVPCLILLGHLTWPAIGTKEHENLTIEAMYQAMTTYPGLWDVWEEVDGMYDPSDFAEFGFSEIWLMDDGMKYTSRSDPRAPADFFCFAPSEQGGFWELERKRWPPFWHLHAGY